MLTVPRSCTNWESKNVQTGGWRARYELWSLDFKAILHQIEILLRDEAMAKLINTGERARGAPMQTTVSLPVEISEDLHRIFILDTAVTIRSNHAANSANGGTPNAGPLRYQILDLALGQSTVKIRSDFDPAHPWPVEDFYHIKFSPSSEFFVLIRESVAKAEKGKHLYRPVWLLQIFRDQKYGCNSEEGSEYLCSTATMLFAVPEVSLLSPVRGVAFHPSLPRLAFPQIYDGLPQTYIWDFDSPVVLSQEVGAYTNPFPVSDPPIIDPVFSDDGKYLYGTDAPIEFGTGAVSTTNLKRLGMFLIAKVPENIAERPEGVDSQVSIGFETGPGQCRVPFQQVALELATRPRQPVQKANTLAFDRDKGGVAHISQLQQLEKEGAVILNTFGTNGMLQSETLSRLPKEVTHCVDVSIIHPKPGLDSDSVRIVLDKAPQRIYTRDDVNKGLLPAILERKKASIPRFITTAPLALGSSARQIFALGSAFGSEGRSTRNFGSSSAFDN